MTHFHGKESANTIVSANHNRTSMVVCYAPFASVTSADIDADQCEFRTKLSLTDAAHDPRWSGVEALQRRFCAIVSPQHWRPEGNKPLHGTSQLLFNSPAYSSIGLALSETNSEMRRAHLAVFDEIDDQTAVSPRSGIMVGNATRMPMVCEE